jgi:general secretion pathway protein M
VKELWARLRTFFAGLSLREQALVGAVGALAVLLVGVLVVLQLLAVGTRLDARVASAEQQLEAMRRLRREFDDVNGRLASVEQRIAEAPRGNLRATLESLAQEGSVPIESMEPQASPSHPRYRETKVEVGLRQVTLAQAVAYLQKIEQAPQPLSIKALRIRTRSEQPDLLDLTFTVSAFEPI